MQDLQIKTFRIHNEADEQAVNEFLTGKMVRHWSTTFSPDSANALEAIGDALKSGGTGSLTTGAGAPAKGAGSPGTWNVFVAYEQRVNEPATERSIHSAAPMPYASHKFQEGRGTSRNPERRETKPREKPERQERPEKPVREE